MRFPTTNYKKKSIASWSWCVTRLRKCRTLGNRLVLSETEQYLSRDPTELSVHLNEYWRHLPIFSLWDIGREDLIISVRFRKFSTTKILVAMAPKVEFQLNLKIHTFLNTLHQWVKAGFHMIADRRKFCDRLPSYRNTLLWSWSQMITENRTMFSVFCDRLRSDRLDFLASWKKHLKKDWSHSKGPMNKHLKPDRDTNLTDPRSEVDRSDCNLRLVWSPNGTKNRIFDRKIWI